MDFQETNSCHDSKSCYEYQRLFIQIGILKTTSILVQVKDLGTREVMNHWHMSLFSCLLLLASNLSLLH